MPSVSDIPIGLYVNLKVTILDVTLQRGILSWGLSSSSSGVGSSGPSLCK